MSTFTVVSPVDGKPLGAVDDMTRDEVVRVVAGLRDSAGEWSALPVDHRVKWLKIFRDWLVDNERELVETLQRETGKPRAEARMEIPYVVEAIKYYARLAHRQLRDERPRRHGVLAITKNQKLWWQPYPVVGIITPWNFPLGLSLLDAVPALIAGATVAVKPSECTPLTLLAATAGWREIGAPPVLRPVTGAAAAGAALVDVVDYVQFTGSTRTGRAIAHAAAERLIPCALELGGKDAMVVLDDADLRRAANAAVWGAMSNAGQMCTSVERVYVHAAVYDRFTELVVDNVRALRCGGDIGPLVTEQQRRVVERHVDDAVRRGATRTSGAGATPTPGRTGRFYPPTVLTDVDHSMACMRHETFGPVLPVMKVADDDEAVARVNDSCYGLSATVFTADRRRAERLARRLDVGAVNINDVFANLFTIALPQGGRRESGLGARNGPGALRKYCRPQAIVTARVRPRREPTWYPYTAIRGYLVHRVSRLISGRGPKICWAGTGLPKS